MSYLCCSICQLISAKFFYSVQNPILKINKTKLNKIKRFVIFVVHFRKGSKTNNTKSVLNSIYFKRTGSSDDLGQLEVREYSEIPEHFKVN